jgi:hypothetical protein
MARPRTWPARKVKSRLNESTKTSGEISVFESMVTALSLISGFDSTELIMYV